MDSAEELLYRLYHEEVVEVFEPQAVSFFCGCSPERSGAALLLIPEAEIEEILEEHKGSIDMQCECCGTHYFFNKKRLINSNKPNKKNPPFMITGIFYALLLLNLFQTMFDSVRNRATMILLGMEINSTELPCFSNIFANLMRI